jgi:predicted nucleic acid-binding protein
MLSLEQCVADACVIIDLYTGNLLEILPGLSFRIVVPDLIVETELLEPRAQNLLDAGWVQAWEFPGEELSRIQDLRTEYRGLTVQDAAALYLAQSLKVPLLTRDKRLRCAAEQSGVAVLDTSWLLEEMLQQDLVRPSRIVLAVGLMEGRGNFLPRRETEQLLSRWGISGG